ncbi:MAG: phytoene desaturase family protein [Bacteroidota bacterium]|nr:phytoene desaturase family protein [Bacteroidota bacterium]
MNSNIDNIVIGSGVAGLAIAIRRRMKSETVLVLEAEPNTGGKLNEKKWEGYRWDTGPSLFTLPETLKDIFDVAGKNIEDYISYNRLPIVTRYYYEDGTIINAYADVNDFAKEIEAKTCDKAEAVIKYLNQAKDKFDMTRPVFIERTLHSWKTYASNAALRAYPKAWKLDAFRTLHRMNTLSFKDERTIQLFDRYATYNGSNPYTAPATLSLISHLEHQLGAFYPKGGIRQIIKALHQLALDIGVEFVNNTKVVEILTQKQTGKLIAAGIKTENGDIVTAKKVYSNVDVWSTYHKLLPDSVKYPKYLEKVKLGTSALIFYWAMENLNSDLDLHNVLFSKNYLAEFHALHTTLSLNTDPTVYIYISSKIEKADAPKGSENWFVMINMPSDLNYTDEIIAQYRTIILNKIRNTIKLEVQKHIAHEELIDPKYLSEHTGSHLGSLYGNASNGPVAAFLRHPNYSSQVQSLYFCGGTVHPGGGIPLCLLSAKIADDMS